MDNTKELPKRKPTRLKEFDYSTCAVYFITICTQNRKRLLSKITVGEGSPLPSEPYVQLSDYGEIVDKWIGNISEKYQNVSVDNYVIMPDHVHVLLSVDKNDGRGNPSPTVDTIVAWLKYQATKEINKVRNKAGERIFQRSFYDHIVRNRDDYRETCKYIFNNPIERYYRERAETE